MLVWCESIKNQLCAGNFCHSSEWMDGMGIGDAHLKIIMNGGRQPNGRIFKIRVALENL